MTLKIPSASTLAQGMRRVKSLVEGVYGSYIKKVSRRVGGPLNSNLRLNVILHSLRRFRFFVSTYILCTALNH